jgi:hypothetical protein
MNINANNNIKAKPIVRNIPMKSMKRVVSKPNQPLSKIPRKYIMEITKINNSQYLSIRKSKIFHWTLF